MKNIRTEIENELDQLRTLTASDFSALAWRDHHEDPIHWKYAAGKRSERYKYIVLRPGHGLAGMVIRLGRPVIVDETVIDVYRIRQEYSIMLVENLHIAAAVPVTISNETHGVLLVGSRAKGTYPKSGIQPISDSAKRLAALILLEDRINP